MRSDLIREGNLECVTANERFAEQEVDRRLDRMIEIAEEIGVSLDEVVKTIGRADQNIFLAVSDNPSKFPR